MANGGLRRGRCTRWNRRRRLGGRKEWVRVKREVRKVVEEEDLGGEVSQTIARDVEFLQPCQPTDAFR